MTFPLALPGVFAGSLLTFIPAMGDYINAELLGNPQTRMIGNVIQNRFLQSRTTTRSASALSFILMAGDPHRGRGLRPAPRHRAADRLMATTAAADRRSTAPATAPRAAARGSACTRWTAACCSPSLAIVYLLLPIAVMIVFSFNDSGGKFNFVWHGFTLNGWLHPFDWPGLPRRGPDQPRRSPSSSTIVATILGTLIGLALTRYQFRGPGRDQRPDLPADGDARDRHGRQPADAVRRDGACRRSRASSRDALPARASRRS